MRQSELFQIAIDMNVGQVYDLSRDDMLGCANGMLASMLDGPPRQGDIDNFIKAISRSWDVSVTYDGLRDVWMLRKEGATAPHYERRCDPSRLTGDFIFKRLPGGNHSVHEATELTALHILSWTMLLKHDLSDTFIPPTKTQAIEKYNRCPHFHIIVDSIVLGVIDILTREE